MSHSTITNDRKYNEQEKDTLHHPQKQTLESKSKSQSPNPSSSSIGSKARVIEIPVQHFQQTTSSHSPSSSTFLNSTNQSAASGQTRNSPLHGADRSNLNEDFPKPSFNNFPSFNNSSLFDNYQSPFDLLNRRPLINRGEGSNSNTPFSAHFGGADADDFFNQSTDRIFGRNSPLKDHLSPNHQQRQASNSPARYGPTDAAAAAAANLNAPTSTSSNSNSNRQSPLSVNTQSTDSPKRYTTQTTIQPNHSPSSSYTNNSSSKIGVEIPITHVSSASPSQKNEKSSYSDFQQPSKTVPDSSKHSSTPPRNPSTTNLSNNEGGAASKMGNSSSSSSANGKNRPGSNYENSDFASPPNNRPNPAPTANQPKTDEDKCNEIEAELNVLEKDVITFAGTKTSDRSYLKLEEMLTRCLLKLDAIERGEDQRINQTRRRLINFTHQLSERLEARATENEKKGGDSSSNLSNESQPSASKRPKSPSENAAANQYSSHQNGGHSLTS